MRRRSPLAPFLGSIALATGVCFGVLAGSPATALARSEKQLGYTPASVWGPLVRFVRVDENLKIVDKDAEAGYLIFELTQDKKVFRGSVEVIAASKEHGVRVILDVSDRPSYVELAMLERLERKLLSELGPAPSPPKKREKKEDKPRDGRDGRDSGEKEKPPEVQEAPLLPIPEAPTTK